MAALATGLAFSRAYGGSGFARPNWGVPGLGWLDIFRTLVIVLVAKNHHMGSYTIILGMALWVTLVCLG